MRRAAATLVCGDASLLVTGRRCLLIATRCQRAALPTAPLSLSRPWICTRWFRASGPAPSPPPPPYATASQGEEEDVLSFEEESSDESDESQDGVFDDEEKEAEVGDGEDGGGIVLGGAPWGAKALELARKMLTPDMALYGFKVCSTGFIQVRLDKLTDKFGSPTIEEVEKFNAAYGVVIEEAGRAGLLPLNIAIEVSSPGAERVVQVPVELGRFRELPMQVVYYTESAEQQQVLELESFDRESLQSVWKLANVRVNREARGKGRLLNRKQREWRLELAVTSIKLVRLHVDAFGGGEDE